MEPLGRCESVAMWLYLSLGWYDVGIALSALLTVPFLLPFPRSTAFGSKMLKGFLYTHLHRSMRGVKCLTAAARAPQVLLHLMACKGLVKASRWA